MLRGTVRGQGGGEAWGKDGGMAHQKKKSAVLRQRKFISPLIENRAWYLEIVAKRIAVRKQFSVKGMYT